MDQQIIGDSGLTWGDYLTGGAELEFGIYRNCLQILAFTPAPLILGRYSHTAGYNDQYSGVSGQQTFTKSMGISTANTIADQSNIKADTSIQYIAVDTGRATRTEDLLVDGASQAQNSSSLILCPFDNADPGIIPAFCNIEQSGSA